MFAGTDTKSPSTPMKVGGEERTIWLRSERTSVKRVYRRSDAKVSWHNSSLPLFSLLLIWKRR
jgi:hypothetical protein